MALLVRKNNLPRLSLRARVRRVVDLGQMLMIQLGVDLRAVQELLGHASISTTQVYTKLDHQHLAKVYDAAHPRAKRKPG